MWRAYLIHIGKNYWNQNSRIPCKFASSFNILDKNSLTLEVRENNYLFGGFLKNWEINDKPRTYNSETWQTTTFVSCYVVFDFLMFYFYDNIGFSEFS